MSMADRMRDGLDKITEALRSRNVSEDEIRRITDGYKELCRGFAQDDDIFAGRKE